MSAHSLHPFHLPELRAHISLFMDLPDLKVCMMVCKAWHTDFQPAVWSRVALNFLKGPDLLAESCLSARESSICKNARWIKHLTLPCVRRVGNAGNVYNLLTAHCRSLVTIDMALEPDFRWRSDYLNLLINNTKLQQVRLRFMALTEAPLLSMRLTTATLPQLHTLELDGIMPLQSILYVLRAYPTVNKFVLRSPRHGLFCGNEKDATQKDPSYPPLNDLPTVLPLQKLEVSGPCQDEAVGILLERCPLLHSLRLGIVSALASQKMCSVLSGLTRLTSLRLGSINMDTQRLVSILNAIPAHQLCAANLMWVDDEPLQLLIERQHQSLEILHAKVNRSQQGVALVEALTRCARLRWLTFMTRRYVEARLLLGNPWVCKGLEHLEVHLTLARDCQQRHLLELGLEEKERLAPSLLEAKQAEVVLMKRLGQLTQLRHLMMQGVANTDKVPGLTWSLSTGLTHLASLSQLCTMRFGLQKLPLGIQELKFIKRVWPSLRLLKCYSIESHKVRQWIEDRWPTLRVCLEIQGEY